MSGKAIAISPCIHLYTLLIILLYQNLRKSYIQPTVLARSHLYLLIITHFPSFLPPSTAASNLSSHSIFNTLPPIISPTFLYTLLLFSFSRLATSSICLIITPFVRSDKTDSSTCCNFSMILQ